MSSEIDSRERLISFVEELREDFTINGQKWENSNLSDYLDAIAASISDIDGYYKNINTDIDCVNVWRLIADILMSATMHE